MRGHSSGFTLIELLVVISTISVLASMVISFTISARAKAVQGAAIAFDTTNYHSLGAGANALFEFDQNLNDLSQNNITLSQSGSWTPTIGYSKGILGMAPNFPGNIVLYSNQYIKNGGSGWTISLWANPTSVADSVLVQLYDGSLLTANLTVGLSGGKYYVNWNDGPSCAATTMTDSVVRTTNEWHLITFSHNANTGVSTMYIDGKLANTTGANPYVGGNCATVYNDTLWLGGAFNGTPYFTGLIDNLRIYSDPLQ